MSRLQRIRLHDGEERLLIAEDLLIKRLNRHLRPHDQRLRQPRTEAKRLDLGAHYLSVRSTGEILERHVVLAAIWDRLHPGAPLPTYPIPEAPPPPVVNDPTNVVRLNPRPANTDDDDDFDDPHYSRRYPDQAWINRRLARHHLKLRTTRGTTRHGELGRHHTTDTRSGEIVHRYVDIYELGERIERRLDPSLWFVAHRLGPAPIDRRH